MALEPDFHAYENYPWHTTPGFEERKMQEYCQADIDSTRRLLEQLREPEKESETGSMVRGAFYLFLIFLPILFLILGLFL